MNLAKRLSGIVVITCTTIVFLVAGCAKESDKGGQAQVEKKPAKEGEQKKEHDHSGWWCEEHGVPESVCSLCSDENAAKCKKEGDWCKLHDRAQSQCFKCEPKRFEKFAAMYRAKYDREPPRPPESEFQK